MARVQIPLRSDGAPICHIHVGVGAERRREIEASGKQAPGQIVNLPALIDTGAGASCLDEDVVAMLGLHPRGFAPLATPSHGDGTAQAALFEASFVVPSYGHPSLTFPELRVAKAPLKIQGFQAIIGRDILRACTFTYNPREGFCVLEFDET